MPAANMDQIRVAKTTTATGDLLSVALEPNSQHLWVGSSDFRIYSIDFAAGLPTATPALEGHSSYVSGLVLAGRKLVSAGARSWIESSWARSARFSRPTPSCAGIVSWSRRSTQSHRRLRWLSACPGSLRVAGPRYEIHGSVPGDPDGSRCETGAAAAEESELQCSQRAFFSARSRKKR